MLSYEPFPETNLLREKGGTQKPFFQISMKRRSFLAQRDFILLCTTRLCLHHHAFSFIISLNLPTLHPALTHRISDSRHKSLISTSPNQSNPYAPAPRMRFIGPLIFVASFFAAAALTTPISSQPNSIQSNSITPDLATRGL